MRKPAFALTLTAITLSRLVINAYRRFPYLILTPMAAALGVPRATVEAALSLQWAMGLTSPLVGPYIDRAGRKRPMLIGLAILAACCGIATLSPLTGIVLLALVIGGMGKTLFDPSVQAYIGDRTPYRWRGTAIGITELAWSGALFVIGPIAALLISQVSLSAIFALISVSALGTIGLVWLLVPGDKPSVAEQAAHPGVGFRDMFRTLRASRNALVMLAVSAGMSFTAESVQIVYEAWLRDTFMLGTVALGTVAWVISIAEVTGEGVVITIADRFGKRRLALVMLAALSIVYLILPRTGGSLNAALVALFAMFLAFETAVVVLIPMSTEILPQARGIMLAANAAAFGLGRTFGTLAGGWMFRTGGFALNGTVAALLSVGAVVLIWRFFDEQPGAAISASSAEVIETKETLE